MRSGSQEILLLQDEVSGREIRWSRADTLATDNACHDHYEIYIHIYGDLSLELDNRLYLLSPGDIMLIPAYTCHRHITPHDRGSRHYSLRIPSGIQSPLFASLYAPPSLLRLSPAAGSRSRLFSLCEQIDVLSAKPETSAARRISLLASLLCLIEDCQAAGDTVQPLPLSEPLTRVAEFVSENLSSEISVSKLAAISGLSAEALSQQFRAELNISTYAYVQRVRTLRAKEMLDAGATVDAARRACGFPDHSRFIERFRRTYGITPHKYCQLLRDRR
ncbi:MAG: helix-turn-helix domain-containing protein [Oscillospiraceae bacterium]|nr:helix-turn-helix domain-containing protein [Oscillospiraceae bacterium]